MKKSLIVAIVLIVVGHLLFVGAFVAFGFNFSKLDISKYETNVHALEEDFDKIEIKTNKTDVIFKPSADGSASVVCLETDKVDHSVAVENGTLKIGEEDGRTLIDHLLFTFKSPSVTVYLPREHYEKLVIDNDTGDVSIPSGFSFGSVNVTVSTGDISLDNIRAGSVELSVSTGKIDLNGVDCGELNSKGSTGDITLKNVLVSGDLKIERTTGDVRFESCDAENITVKTTTGSVKGTLRTGKIFAAKASTGRVRVPDTASGGKCDITTSTGSIDIRIAS